MSIDLEEFQTRIRLRELTLEDYDAVVAIQRRCFPRMQPWGRAQFESQLAVFPEGQLGIEIDGRLVASSAALIVDSSEYSEWHNWFELSDHGFIRNHDPEGETLYGIEIQVDPEFQGMKLARRLYEARKDLCRRLNLAHMMIGGRIPGYAEHRDRLSAQEYVQGVIAKRLYDPVLTAQLANDFVLKQIIPDYLPSDEDSAGYATFLEWANLDYRVVPSRRTRRAYEPCRLALVQYEMRPIQSFDEFARQCEFFVDTASDSRSDFLLFPELLTLQLLSLVKGEQPGMAARKLAQMTPDYLELFGGLAVRYNLNIIGGSSFVVDDGRLLNVSYLFRRDGTIAAQPKLHITPNERRWWGVEPGEQLRVHETDCGRVAILVCYDVQFPELCRMACAMGARVLFVPYNTPDRYGYLRVRHCAQARAIENHVYVVTAGCVGNLPFVENADIHYAQSAILTPSDVQFARDGIAIEASPNLETVLIRDVDLEELRRHRRGGTVQNWNDRRTDLYELTWKEGTARKTI
jgi:predicted amidohydrolase/ribosomal protein S18 acetylase RimI-like enzyme